MKTYRKAASVLVLRSRAGKDEILLVHKPRTIDAWQLPQGGIEDGESLEEAALRELREETGIVAPRITWVSAVTYSYDFPPDFRKQDGSRPRRDGQFVRFVVLVAPDEASLHVDGQEIDDHVWVSLGEIGTYVKRDTYLQIIRSVLRAYDEAGRPGAM
jgi:putative (di)nucleoside polyphosphate hydrolase